MFDVHNAFRPFQGVNQCHVLPRLTGSSMGVDSLIKDMSDMLSSVFFNIFICLLSIVLMWSGANFVVTNASIIARRFNISELVFGLTVVAMGTSAPELLVTATAAFKGYVSKSKTSMTQT